jgi:hypothetical protein
MADTSKPKEERKSWHALSYQEQQQRQLEKLFQRVDKPIVIPEGPKEKSLKPPPDIVRNVQGRNQLSGYGSNSRYIGTKSFVHTV